MNLVSNSVVSHFQNEAVVSFLHLWRTNSRVQCREGPPRIPIYRYASTCGIQSKPSELHFSPSRFQTRDTSHNRQERVPRCISIGLRDRITVLREALKGGLLKQTCVPRGPESDDKAPYQLHSRVQLAHLSMEIVQGTKARHRRHTPLETTRQWYSAANPEGFFDAFKRRTCDLNFSVHNHRPNPMSLCSIG